MEAKLKTLKVAELKELLTKAQQPPPPKATKSDLIARIVASKEATDVYNAKYAPKDDLLAPPEDLDWDVEQVNSPTEPPPPSSSTPASVPAPAAPPNNTTVTAPAAAAPAAPSDDAKSAVDSELDKRKQRAERFGIPLVEAKSPVTKKSAKAAAATKTPREVTEKLDARAARFGTGQKRPAATEEVDAEEQERRRKQKKQTVYGATFTVLSEPEAVAELSRCARPQSVGVADIVSLQPCATPTERSQDRYISSDWLISDQTWRFHAVFDGHAGHETVDHIVNTLPTAIHDALVAGLSTESLDVSAVLRDAIAQIDKQIGQDLLDLFPGGPDALANMTDDEVAALINDGGVNSTKVLRCMRGSTVLVALVGPALDVWVASLGDCQCVLGTKTAAGEWQATVLSSNHNGADQAEATRIRNEHPGEDECMLRDRVLGAIAVTRAVGDFLFKLPAIYTTRIFLNAKPGFQISSKIGDFLGRNLTPPYLSAQCDVQHVNVPSLGATEAFLILASDGLIDLSGDTYGLNHREPAVSAKKWVQVLGREDRDGNAALYLLRDAMGWDGESLSSLLTVEWEDGRWMDDTTIIRRVAGLPPVSAELFNQKVLDRRLETAVMSSPKGSYCEVCNKTYTTENAYRSHINSKKHKDAEIKSKLAPPRVAAQEVAPEPTEVPIAPALDTISEPQVVSLVVDGDASDSEINQTIDEKIAAARSRLTPNSCLFCSHDSTGLDENLTHMSIAHSFFVPDAEYLIDIQGLISYLGEKIAMGNVCIYCNGKGKEFRTLDATRKHMLDKGHCKIAYDSEDDRLEVSDFYDFTSSYPETASKQSDTKHADDEEWEDSDDDGESADEIVEADEEEQSDESDDLPETQITYGDSNLELILPSGARIGHRNLRRYYPQRFPGSRGKPEDPNSGAALVRRLLADKNSALVPRKGGFGAFGSGTEVVKARNRGEAREAGRHVREFRDQKRREDFKTKVAFIHNSQKHFRDPLLDLSN
ncbi:C2H2 type zinc-finger-domain-containing protein [Favolaschia claudopus]|uniref:C2H2 type zinc-finger-domain-containing protein n=1 Tax=Favolaschia claudopus TaxID=2862362 RepID=A0AAW0E0C6_9AGAR